MSRVRADEFTNTEANGAPTFTHGIKIGSGTVVEGNPDANDLTIEASSGYAGITLRSATDQGGALYFSDATSGSGEYDGYITYGHSNSSMLFGTAGQGTARAIIDGSGNFGLGVLTPVGKAEVSGNDGLNISNATRTGSSGAQWRLIPHNGGGSATNLRLYEGVGATEVLNVTKEGYILVNTTLSRIVEDWAGNGPQGKIQIEATNSDAIMSIISAGTSDANRCGTLVLGRTRDSSTSQDPPTIVQNGDTLGAITFCGSDGVDMRSKAAYIRCEVHGSPGTDDMPGMLYHATRPDGGVAPVKRHRIGNGGMISTFADTGWESNIFYNANGAGTSRAFIIGRHSATGLDAVGGTAGTSSFEVYTNGNIVNTNNSYGQISDVSLKENIVDANSQWADIKSVKVRNFNFKEGQTHKQIGVVAQELETVSPGLVYENRDNLKGVNTSVLYMKALRALQEAMARIETLESEVTALKG